MAGMKVRWEVGPREMIGNKNPKTGLLDPRLGKNKGPVYKQLVVKVMEPK